MKPTQTMLEKWLQHCRTAGHRTLADAVEAGEETEGKNLATYAVGVTKIFCNSRGCLWCFEDTDALSRLSENKKGE